MAEEPVPGGREEGRIGRRVPLTFSLVFLLTDFVKMMTGKIGRSHRKVGVFWLLLADHRFICDLFTFAQQGITLWSTQEEPVFPFQSGSSVYFLYVCRFLSTLYHQPRTTVAVNNIHGISIHHWQAY